MRGSQPIFICRDSIAGWMNQYQQSSALFASDFAPGFAPAPISRISSQLGMEHGLHQNPYTPAVCISKECPP